MSMFLPILISKAVETIAPGCEEIMGFIQTERTHPSTTQLTSQIKLAPVERPILS